MSTPSITNGSNRIVWFILTTITTVMLLMAGAWASTTSTALAETDRRLGELERRFERIDTKLDTLLEYSKHPNRK